MQIFQEIFSVFHLDFLMKVMSENHIFKLIYINIEKRERRGADIRPFFINFARYMDYYLTIDRGNSHIKGGLWTSQGKLVGFESAQSDRSASSVALDLIAPVFEGADTLAGCAYSSVVRSRDVEDVASLQTICNRVLQVNASTHLPFSIAYNTPATLGADRIAAVAGAIELAPQGRSILVVDAGTAVTYEFVTPQRVYLGGNIAPGLNIRLRSLHHFTSALPEVGLDGPVPVVGDATAEAMRSGAVRGLLGEILYYISQAENPPVAVLTGGGCAYLAEQSLLTFEHILDAHLVLRGLYSILRYNESN